jgi:hypothetical protein
MGGQYRQDAGLRNMFDWGVGIFVDRDFEIFLRLDRIGGVGLLGPFLGPVEFLDRIGLAPVVFGLELVVSGDAPGQQERTGQDECEEGLKAKEFHEEISVEAVAVAGWLGS